MPGTARSQAATQTVLGGPAPNAKASLAETTIISTELESGASFAANRDSDDLLRAEFYLSPDFFRGRSPWGGAVPDMFKLNSSTQMDTRGFWWGWDCPEELKKFLGIVWRDWVPASRCDFCIYEAVGCYLDVYFCPLHKGLVI